VIFGSPVWRATFRKSSNKVKTRWIFGLQVPTFDLDRAMIDRTVRMHFRRAKPFGLLWPTWTFWVSILQMKTGCRKTRPF
jgi:hypothetical protein